MSDDKRQTYIVMAKGEGTPLGGALGVAEARSILHMLQGVMINKFLSILLGIFQYMTIGVIVTSFPLGI